MNSESSYLEWRVRYTRRFKGSGVDRGCGRERETKNCKGLDKGKGKGGIEDGAKCGICAVQSS